MVEQSIFTRLDQRPVKRRVIAFDLDGTLAPSKSLLPDRMSIVLSDLLGKYEVLVMSGGRFEQFEKQLLANLKIEPEKLAKLHLMPTCVTRYYRFRNNGWQKQYAEDLSGTEKAKIVQELNKAVAHFGLSTKKTYGPTIEDRESQISWSALGQDIVEVLGEEGIKLKEAWDPDMSKKLTLVNYLTPLLPEFEVRAGGSTTVDITKKGIDKAYGMKKMLDMLKLSKDDVLFIGDRLEEGGNDYPVKAMGIDCMQISDWQETALVIEAVLRTS